MAFDTKDWDIICETLKKFQHELESKVKAYSDIYSEEPYPTEVQKNAVWIKDVCEYAQKLLKIQRDFIDMVKKGPHPISE
jgi:hypothetical protein